MIGRVVGNYKILDKLGEGGMGAVFRGVDVMVEREVAIKMLRPEIARQPEIVERFRSEAVTLAKLNHPGIATLFSFFREGEEYFMVMEFVPGRSLDALLREFGPMPADQAVPIFVKILAGIQHAHDLGILHRDIKPANVMMTSAGAVKVTDFGIARIVGAARMTRQGNIVGTLEYIAPERVKGEEHDSRSDIYSLGAVLYEILTGRLPFERENEYALMQAHLFEPPPPMGSFGRPVPPELEAVVARALAKKPEDRIESASQFGIALTAAWERSRTSPAARETRMAAGVPPSRLTRLAAPGESWSQYIAAAQPAAAARGPVVPPRPNRAVWAAAIAVVLALVAAGVWFGLRGGPGAEPGPGVQQQQAGGAPQQKAKDPGIPGVGEVPKEVRPSPAQSILRDSVPIPESREAGRPAARTEKASAPPQPVPAAESPSEEERRRAALKALEQGGEAEAKERERKRLEALKALQK